MNGFFCPFINCHSLIFEGSHYYYTPKLSLTYNLVMITRMDNKPSSTWLFPIPTTCTPTPMEGGRGDSIIVGSATDADGGPHSVPPNLSNHASNFHNLGPPPLCAGCNLRIVDKFYLSAVDSKWHVNCLKCSECGMELESQVSCYERDGLILCKEDYLR